MKEFNIYQNAFIDGAKVSFQGEIYKKEIKNNKVLYYMQDAYLQSEYFTEIKSNSKENPKEKQKEAAEKQNLKDKQKEAAEKQNPKDKQREAAEKIKFNNGEIYCKNIVVSLDEDSYPIGTVCVGTGSIKEFSEARNEGNFDERNYYYSLGIAAKLENCNIQDTYESQWAMRRFRGNICEKLYFLRMIIGNIFVENLPGEEAGVMSTISLGDKSLLDPEVKQIYQTSGIAHLLSVSGLHISVLAMGIYNFLRKRGISFVTSGTFSITLLVLYGEMVGMGLPVKRAIIMYVIYVVANIIGEAYDSLTALAVAALIIVVENPMVVRNTGFIFSFCAVIGVVTIGQRMKKLFDRFWIRKLEENNIRKQEQTWKMKIVYKCISSLVFCMGISLSTMPIVGKLYYEVPIYSIFLNFLLLPFMPCLLGIGIVGGLVGVFEMILFGGSFFSGFLMKVCHFILYCYEAISDWSIHLPGARQIVGDLGLWKIVIYYLLLYFWAFVILENKKIRFRNCLPLVGMFLILFGPRQAHFEIDMLDCGQGDSIYIADDNGLRYFIDGGSTSVKNVGQYRILPFLQFKGAKHIDYWFVSHTDEDHISGLIEAIESGYEIRHILFSKGMDISKLQDLMDENEISYGFISCGDKVVAGDMVFECIYPGETLEFEGVNENCMVLLMKYGDFSGLFTGDIGIEQEKAIIESGVLNFEDDSNQDFSKSNSGRGFNQDFSKSNKSKAGIDVSNLLVKERLSLYKVGHHGSKGSNSMEFLQVIRPEYSIISAGENNRYGHPSPETIERMDELDLTHYCTIDCGQIKVALDDGVVVVERFVDGEG
ncbi:MAG: ComEC/Rec2 family competence protein [Lachnospiraceae bacterium]|nr:ComEC/Rec2 family competence protein [Lachnospiraceae bacterium]